MTTLEEHESQFRTEQAERLAAPGVDLQPELAAALVVFQGAVPAITKTRTARVKMRTGGEYTYNYADLADILAAIRAPLKAAGLAVTQSLNGSGSGLMTITTTVWHSSGQKTSAMIEIPTGDRTPQEVGSQITYFKRYALSAELGISTEEDDDGAAASRHRERQPEPEPAVDPALPAEVEAANEARTVLLEATAEYGWNWDKLVGEYWKRFSKNLKNTRDADKINEFTELLIAEAGDGKPLDAAPPTPEAVQLAVELEKHDRAASERKAAAADKRITPAQKPANPIKPHQLTKLNTLLTRNGYKDHDSAVQWCSEALGITVDSRNNLTTAEASKLITKLEDQEKDQEKELPPNDDNNIGTG